MKKAMSFLRATDGAVSSDFVLLTAGVIGLALAVSLTVREYSVALGPAVSQQIDDQFN